MRPPRVAGATTRHRAASCGRGNAGRCARARRALRTWRRFLVFGFFRCVVGADVGRGGCGCDRSLHPEPAAKIAGFKAGRLIERVVLLDRGEHTAVDGVRWAVAAGAELAREDRSERTDLVVWPHKEDFLGIVSRDDLCGPFGGDVLTVSETSGASTDFDVVLLADLRGKLGGEFAADVHGLRGAVFLDRLGEGPDEFCTEAGACGDAAPEGFILLWA